MVCREWENAPGDPRRCGERFDMGEDSGTIFCELDKDHSSEFHRSSPAGFEWCGRELWPIPPEATEVA